MLESGYFQDLGISALWLTPFNKGADGTYMASDNENDPDCIMPMPSLVTDRWKILFL